MENEVVTIDAQFLVSAFGTAVVLVGVLITIIAKIWLEVLRKDIKTVNNNVAEAKELVHDAHNRITEHVEKFHTGNDK